MARPLVDQDIPFPQDAPAPLQGRVMQVRVDLRRDKVNFLLDLPDHLPVEMEQYAFAFSARVAAEIGLDPGTANVQPRIFNN